jgi:hypothetical protein
MLAERKIVQTGLSHTMHVVEFRCGLSGANRVLWLGDSQPLRLAGSGEI